jgi:pyruvate dehydrogenase E2 component (dihydrolipoamide acetyltransferase)
VRAVREVVMPRLSDSMDEGTILRWLKTDGDAVRAGEELVEIETDKATVVHDADEQGVLEVVAAVGETLPVGAVIARLADSGGEGHATAEPVVAGVQAHAVPAAPPAPPARTTPTAGPKGEVTVREPTRAQGLVARRMAESKATIPDFTVTVQADVEDALALCDQLDGRSDPLPTLDDLVVKAAALALREHPRVNGAYRDGRFELYSRVNVAVAVATEDALVAPTVFDADSKPVTRIAQETRALAERAHAGTVTPPELAGATFTVSSLGAFGASGFTAVVSPGQAAVLAVGAAIARPVARDGAVAVRHVMELTLTCDHRILYGAGAGRFLSRVRDLLERPAALLL